MMKSTIIGMAVALGVALPSGPAAAWASANRFGGSTEHSPGATEHTNAFGGSSEHAYGEGSEHTNMYGGSSAHAWGGGTTHTNVYGGTTTGAYGAGAVHTTPYGATAYRPPVYAPYHPPVAVPYYSSGCYNCAGAAAAGAVVGIAAGAAIASANTAAATNSAYSSGYAAGSVNTAAAYAVGVNYAALPAGATPIAKYGTTYYLVGNTWFLPAYGANGVYYRVVPTP
ncbi:conserved membrane hypothetical protein [Candidatus Accumulibacter aalborgensis]|uniref:Uncharacterized protein n=1 Tax=Candidatus Accumulibacter aalborgensis TaxID=1860102 RepID=A0A1A8XE97_9PROT|nr:hypothetical protein [Candidatus Accumulibacter aalborgensis]SBT03495.1 conserved membrane hypothetical protein [Candidatus Accumulibacter aalborgensis]